jgi:hypothetical protein
LVAILFQHYRSWILKICTNVLETVIFSIDEYLPYLVVVWIFLFHLCCFSVMNMPSSVRQEQLDKDLVPSPRITKCWDLSCAQLCKKWSVYNKVLVPWFSMP